MDYILISTQIRCETGPTVVGDVDSDPEIMGELGAKKVFRYFTRILCSKKYISFEFFEQYLLLDSNLG